MEKICEYCEKEFSKPYTRSLKEWKKSRFCSKGCRFKGFRFTKKTKEKMRQVRLERKKRDGYLVSPESRKKISETNKKSGVGKWMKGRGGKKHWNWQGGKSYELYGFDWTELLRHSIRTRDCFVCQICNKNGWIVHHIDYNKKNNNPNNLITLCRNCHMKTNFNRKYWLNYFNKEGNVE